MLEVYAEHGESLVRQIQRQMMLVMVACFGH